MEHDPVEIIKKLKEIDPDFKLPPTTVERLLGKIEANKNNELALIKNSSQSFRRSRRSQKSEEGTAPVLTAPTLNIDEKKKIKKLEEEMKALISKIKTDQNCANNKKLIGSFGEVIGFVKWNIVFNTGLENIETILSILIIGFIVHFSMDFLLRLFYLKTTSF